MRIGGEQLTHHVPQREQVEGDENLVRGQIAVTRRQVNCTRA
jgi:hypothetical protein